MRQRREPAITGIDMHPQIESFRHGADFRERIKRASHHRAGICHYAEGQVSRLHVFRDLRDEIINVDLVPRIDPHFAHVVAPDA